MDSANPLPVHAGNTVSPTRLTNGQWQKGQSGNPNGKPKGNLSLTALLKRELTKIPPGEKQGRTWMQLLVLAWLTGALKNPVLMKEVLERVDGRVPQPLAGEEGGPIIIKVVYEQATPKA